MTRIRSAFISARPGAWLSVISALAGAVAGMAVAVAADPMSDTFQPDVFRMGNALQQRMSGFIDPLGRDCPLPAGALTFPAAVDLALCRNPSTRSTWAAARQQAAALGSAESAWLPSLTATDSESRVFGNHVDVTGTPVSTTQNTTDAAVNLSWTLYDFGARGGRITSARRLLDAAALTANSVSQQTILTVAQGYYGVVAADADLVAAQTSEAAFARALEIARALQKGGAASLADVLQAETAFDGAVLARVQADAAAKVARGTLANALGLDADRPLTLDAQPVPAEVPALTARMADLMAEAARQRPDLAAALAQRDAAVADITVARAAGRPTISIGAGPNFVDTPGVARQSYNQLNISVTVPIFSGFNVDYNVRQAQAVLEAREASAEQTRLGVSLGVWNAYYGLDSANQQLTATGALLKTSEDNKQVALGRYGAGVGTILDVLTALQAAAAAEQLRISAELAWQVGRAQLALALGRLTGAEPLADSAAFP